MRTRMLGALGAALLMVAGFTGCGSNSTYQNSPRPPAPINVTVSLTNARVQISPARVGAGPAVLLVANEGSRSRDLTLQASDGSSGSCLAEDRLQWPDQPAGDGATARRAGAGRVRGGRARRRPRVRAADGRPRAPESAQADLLQP